MIQKTLKRVENTFLCETIISNVFKSVDHVLKFSAINIREKLFLESGNDTNHQFNLIDVITFGVN